MERIVPESKETREVIVEDAPAEKAETPAETEQEQEQSVPQGQPATPIAEGDLERVNASWKEIRAAAKEISAEDRRAAQFLPFGHRAQGALAAGLFQRTAALQDGEWA